MKYTFEITIAGCAVNCAHCYVSGGTGTPMRFDDYRLCIEKLKPALDDLNGDIAVTLGNELFCSPDIANIIDYNLNSIPEYFSYRDFAVPTTGTALISRSDRNEILRSLRSAGTEKFMLALHGSKDNHNRAVHNPRAFDELFRTVGFLAENGFDVLFNIIVSKLLPDGFPEILERISAADSCTARLTVPLYVPTERMRRYQSLRADYNDCMRIAELADKYNIDTRPINEHCISHSEKAVLADISANGFNYGLERSNAADWAFFNITQDLDVYYGNAGAHTKYLGNLKSMNSDELYQAVRPLKANCDYNAFYDDEVFYTLENRLQNLPYVSENLVYPSKADCVYAMLDKMNTPNILI